MSRKIISFQALPEVVCQFGGKTTKRPTFAYALASDGTVWETWETASLTWAPWRQLPSIPQD